MSSDESRSTIEVTLPFPEIRFTEIAHLAHEQQCEILQKCIQVDSVQRIYRQSNYFTRYVWLVPAVGAVVSLTLRFIAPEFAYYLLWPVVAVAIIGVPTAMIVAHVRVRRELRRVVQLELEALAQK